MANPTQTEQLIEKLTDEMQPVRRWVRPGLRAAAWLLLVAALTTALVLHFANLAVFMQRVAEPRVATECVATAVTGITAVFAAFILAVPGSSPRWMALPLPSLLLWLGASGLGCLRNGWVNHGAGGIVGESAHCFVFILGASVPLAIALFAALRRARPIAPLPVAVLGLLGVAATAAFVLQFFHPFDVTAIDLALHLAAIGLVVLIGTQLRRPLLAAD